jgi:HEAT repeat protein
MSAAALADSTTLSRELLALVRDQAKSRELRRSALAWVVRRRDVPGEMSGEEVVRLVSAMARDENEQSSMRQHAASLLGRFDRGEGIPTLITFAGSSEDGWLAKQAVEALARSGDPRARRALRTLVAAADTPEESRVAVIGGLANEYSTAKDAELIRDAYPRLTSDRSRDAAIGAAGSIGGAASRAWLVTIVKDRDQAIRQRRKAAEQLDRAGVPVGEVVKLYDQVDDSELRSQFIDVLAQARTKDATTKLLAIAKDDPQVSLRRRAISALGRVDDPAVRTALKGIVEGTGSR